MIREDDIVHENGDFWVGRLRKERCYTVYRIGVTHSTPDSSYEMNPDGLSIAIARANYLAKRSAVHASIQ